MTLHYIALHCFPLYYIALHCITLHYIALHCITLPYIALHWITLHCITLHYITHIHTLIHWYCRLSIWVQEQWFIVWKSRCKLWSGTRQSLTACFMCHRSAEFHERQAWLESKSRRGLSPAICTEHWTVERCEKLWTDLESLYYIVLQYSLQCKDTWISLCINFTKTL